MSGAPGKRIDENLSRQPPYKLAKFVCENSEYNCTQDQPFRLHEEAINSALEVVVVTWHHLFSPPGGDLIASATIVSHAEVGGDLRFIA